METALQKFQELVAVISATASEAKQTNPVMLERLRRKKIIKSNVTPVGVAVTEYHFEEIYKPSWHKARFAVIDQLNKNANYNDLITDIKRDLGIMQNGEPFMYQMTNVLIDDVFADRKRDLPEMIEILRKEVKDQPIQTWTDIRIHGFAILAPKIEFLLAGKQFTFRQPEISDLEEELSDFGVSVNPPWSRPDSFLRISMLAKRELELQFEKAHTEAALRLFAVGPFTCPTQSFHSESVGRFFGGTMSTGMIRPVQPFQLKLEDVVSFKDFLSECYNKIPAEFYNYSTEQEDFLKIAYDRYCDGLFHVGRIEGKIAFAIMGLEAMFLRGEKEELKYRLSLRIAKVFTKMGLNAQDISNRIQTGYNIRSVYVHGGHLTANKRGNYEKKVNLTLEALSLALLNDLRVSLLLFILTTLEKDMLLDLIEDSLLSNSKDREMENIIEARKHLLNPAFAELTGADSV